MASNLMKCFYVIFIISIFSLHTVKCVELDVGGEIGWVTPPSKNQQFYNDWASENRFQVNDTLRFVYKKDSVMVVTEEEYNKCTSPRPIYFSNNGTALVRLGCPGLFYFISGVSGHCHKGLKMIVKVLELDPPPTAATQQAGAAASIGFPVFALLSSLVGISIFFV